MKIKYLSLLFILLASSAELYCQADTLSKKEQRRQAWEEKKSGAEQDATKKFELMKEMVLSGRFVIEADRLTDRRGNAYNVQSELNYILLDSLYGIIQTGNRFSTGGNGIGGATSSGEVRNYSVKIIEKRKSFNIKYDLYERVGSNSISISVSSSGFASAMVRDNIMDDVVRFSGNMVSLHESSIYKGPRDL